MTNQQEPVNGIYTQIFNPLRKPLSAYNCPVCGNVGFIENIHQLAKCICRSAAAKAYAKIYACLTVPGFVK